MGSRGKGKRLYLSLYVGINDVRELRRYQSIAVNIYVRNVEGDVIAIVTV
jgi:hypothetical protein